VSNYDTRGLITFAENESMISILERFRENAETDIEGLTQEIVDMHGQPFA
jgi:hypothetical protein